MTSLRYFTRTLWQYMGTLLLSLFLALLAFAVGSYLIFDGFSDNPSDPQFLSAAIITDQGYQLTEEIQELMEQEGIWLMVLAEDGTVADSYLLPEELNHDYNVIEIAKASRWYLDDYTVFSYDIGGQLLVLGYPSSDYVRLPSNYYRLEHLYQVFVLFVMIVLVLIVFYFLLMWRARLKLRQEFAPIRQGLEKLSKQEPVFLDERGNLSEITSAINQTSQLLEENRELRNHWIRGVSHDLRNPLTLILANTQELTQLPQKEKIDSQIQRMEDIISSLNMSYLLENPDLKKQMKRLNLSALLRQTIADYLNQYPAIQLDFDLPYEDAYVIGDANLLRRVLDNLILNSLKHNQAPAISLSLTSYEGHYRVTIRDDGTISQKEVADLDQKSRHYDSHGMGVIITKQIIAMHDGQIRFSFGNPGLVAEIELAAASN